MCPTRYDFAAQSVLTLFAGERSMFSNNEQLDNGFVSTWKVKHLILEILKKKQGLLLVTLKIATSFTIPPPPELASELQWPVYPDPDTLSTLGPDIMYILWFDYT